MNTNRLTTLIGLTTLALMLSGCTKNYPPARKAWFSVEKPPMKIVYLDAENGLKPEIMTFMVKVAAEQPYHDNTLTSNTDISATFSGTQSDTESNSDTRSVTLQAK